MVNFRSVKILSLLLFLGSGVALGHSGAKVWVAKEVSARQCESRLDDVLKLELETLKKAGIKVYQSRMKRSGKMMVQLCGTEEKGQVQVEMSKKNQNKAAAQGYSILLNR